MFSFYVKILIIFGCLLHSSSAQFWSCSTNADCSTLAGSYCSDGICSCPPGQQSVLGGTLCADLAPYHVSTCHEDFQCSRMFTSYECYKNGGSETGVCQCQPGFHFFLTRCWESRSYGESCERDEQCYSVAYDPNSMACNGVCVCADGYYERQRGECRKMAAAVGEACVINEDCQFTNGVCDRLSFSCILDTGSAIRRDGKLSNETASKMKSPAKMADELNMATRQHGVACGVGNACAPPFECSIYGSCICPLGYYSNADGTLCLAELGTPVSSEAECQGLLAEVIDGICTCPANFFHDQNMRDCVKVTREISEACTLDENCYTFGVSSICGEPQGPWGMRTCTCREELSVWDEAREMCRLFAGIGDFCEVDSDCLAGALEIQCQLNSQGQGVCTCPDGFLENNGLCLTTGLGLGDVCQASLECTATANTECIDDVCTCSNGYLAEDGFCAPTLGGSCEADEDCVISNSVCSPDSSTCQCGDSFVEYDDLCWPLVEGLNSTCEVQAQCTQALGSDSSCLEGHCQCQSAAHYRDEWCWPMTGLFAACSRTSECYLAEVTDRTVCRNGFCQCDFDYPYSESQNTCTSSASRTIFSALLITALLTLVFI